MHKFQTKQINSLKVTFSNINIFHYHYKLQRYEEIKSTSSKIVLEILHYTFAIAYLILISVLKHVNVNVGRNK